MFREMRRKDRLMEQEQCIEVLKTNTRGILSVLGDDGYPYGVPVHHVYHNGKIYFHCAKVGHKLDAIAKEDKVSFCVVDHEKILQEKLSTQFKSVIVFGKAAVITDEEERMDVFRAIIRILTPDLKEEDVDYAKAGVAHASIVGITIEHMTGKAANQ